MAESIWKGSISFGLINIPVGLRKAEQEHELHFSMLDKRNMAAIKYKKINAATGREVPWNSIAKGYEFEKGQYVLIDKTDFEAANPKATQTIDIEDFVELDEIDPMFLEKPYYVVPQKNGIKSYFLLLEALKKTHKVAIGKIVIRTKQRLAAVMTHGDYLILELMRFPHEVLTAKDVDYIKGIHKPRLIPKELKMAEELIRGMTSKWKPEAYKDTYYDDMMGLIKRKIKRGQGQAITDDHRASEKIKPSNVVDLMPLLRKSLDQYKKKERTHKTTKGKKKAVHKRSA